MSGTETERKFVVPSLSAVQPDGTGTSSGQSGIGDGVLIKQAYVLNKDGHSLRVRIADDEAALTLKGPLHGASRTENEQQVGCDFAYSLLDMCKGRMVIKVRYKVPWGGHVWEVDAFRGSNEGLLLAEIELESEDEPILVPTWCANEVTFDQRYYNEHLADHPYSTWN